METKSNFAEFSEINSPKKMADFCRNFLTVQILLESDWFCADLKNVFNEKKKKAILPIWGKMMRSLSVKPMQ